MNRVEWEKGHSDGFVVGRPRGSGRDYEAGYVDGAYSHLIRHHNLPIPCVTMTAKEAYREYERRGLIPCRERAE